MLTEKDSEIGTIAAIGPSADAPPLEVRAARSRERSRCRPRRPSWRIPATRPRCAARSRRRRPASSFRSWSARPRRSPPSLASTVSRSTRFEIVDAPHSEAAAAKAVELIHAVQGRAADEGQPAHRRADARGGLEQDRPAHARRISHVFVMDVPTYAETLFITDAAINIFPDLDAKRDIVQNAIDLFTQVGLGTPRVAILSAVETVTTKIPSTIEAAALCKMADRGQITGGILDGPLAFDNAIDPEAARIKGIKSAVAGRAQILVVPDLEAGNMLAKNLDLPRQGGRGRDRARRARADRPDLARRFGACAHGLLRGRRALRACAPRARPRCRRRDADGYDPRRQCRLLERQVPGVRDRREQRPHAPDQGADGRHRRAAATARRRPPTGPS